MRTSENREYISPRCEVLNVKAQSIICASDDSTEIVGEIDGEW